MCLKVVDKRRSECLRQDIKKNNKTRCFIWRSVNYNNREKNPTFKHAKKKRSRKIYKKGQNRTVLRLSYNIKYQNILKKQSQNCDERNVCDP